MRRVDLGNIPFYDMMSKGRYYVDKTLLIKDILDLDDNGVYLYTRPRRFGKTLNLQMLDAFFNLDYAGNDWFDDLAISEYHEYDRHRNAYPVIRLDMGLCKESSFDSFINMFSEVIHDAFDRHRYLLDSDAMFPRVRRLFEQLDAGEMTPDALKTSVKNLSSELTRFHGVRPIILIDEYDRAVSDSFGEAIYSSIMDFIGSFMYATIKGNENRSLVYVTGVMQIAKESIFSGLNNISVDNVFSRRSDERFGFTETEVRDLLSYYGRLDDFNIVKEWYDGYRFGDAEVYNPYSILNYVSKNEGTKPYWSNTANDTIIGWLLDRVDMDTFSQVMSLVNGGSVQVKLDETMTYNDVRHRLDSLYSLMVVSGYLKAVPTGGGMYEVSIPNKEVMTVVENKMLDVCPIDDGSYREFNAAVLNGDAERMVTILQSVLKDASYLTLRDEHDYQLVLMSIMHSLSRMYSTRIEYEAGNGRLDIILNPNRDGLISLIFELKKVDSEDQLDRYANEAISQIHDKRYYMDMEGDVMLFGVVFWGKVPKVVTEKVCIRDGRLVS